MRWVGGVRCLGLFPKKSRFFLPLPLQRYICHIYDVDITIITLGFNQKDDVGEEFMMNDMEEEYECICPLKIVQSECSLESLEFNIDLQPLGMIVKATFFMTYLYQA